MSWSYLAQQTLNAIQVSAFYGLLAVAYVLVHGITGRVNLAFGSLAIWSGYLTINGSLMLMLKFPGWTLLPVLVAALVAVANTAVVGYVIGRSVIRPLMRHGTLAILIATLAVAIVLEELMRLVNSSREVWLMPVLNQPIVLGAGAGGTIQITQAQLLVVLLAVTLAAGLMLFIARHPFGRIWRAVADDPTMASLSGINIGAAVVTTFVIASSYAAFAGAMFAVYYGAVSFHGGLVIGLKTLFVAVAGGLNSVSGAFAGALLIGFLETYWSAYFGLEYRDVAAFLMLTGLLVIFPQGIFAAPARRD